MIITKKSIYSISKIMMSVSILVSFAVPCLAKNKAKNEDILINEALDKLPKRQKNKRPTAKEIAKRIEVAERIKTCAPRLQQTDALIGKFYEVQVPVLTKHREALENLVAKRKGAAKKDAKHKLAIFNAKYNEIKDFVQNEGPKLREACINNNAEAAIAYQMYLTPFVEGLKEYASYVTNGKTNLVYEKIFSEWAQEINTKK